MYFNLDVASLSCNSSIKHWAFRFFIFKQFQKNIQIVNLMPLWHVNVGSWFIITIQRGSIKFTLDKNLTKFGLIIDRNVLLFLEINTFLKLLLYRHYIKYFKPLNKRKHLCLWASFRVPLHIRYLVNSNTTFLFEKNIWQRF